MKTIKTVEELELSVFAGAARWETVVQCDPAELAIEYEIQPAEPGYPACAVIRKAVTTAPVKFENDITVILPAGMEVREMLTKYWKDRIEEEAFKEWEADCADAALDFALLGAA